MNENYRDPRVGDQVRVEVPGEVIEIMARYGVAGLVVTVNENVTEVWVPLDRAVLLVRGHVKR